MFIKAHTSSTLSKASRLSAHLPGLTMVSGSTTVSWTRRRGHAYLLAMIQRWLGFALQCVIAILAVVVITLATQMRSNVGFTGASLVTLMTFGDAVSLIITCYTRVETSIGAVSRLKTSATRFCP